MKKNNKIIEFETKKGKFLAVKPTKSVSYCDDDQMLIAVDKLSWMDTIVQIPEKGFGFNSLLSKLTESKCKKIVESDNGEYGKIMYREYSSENVWFKEDLTALESFKSLLEKNEIYTVNPFKKPNQNDYCDDFGNYESDMVQWKIAQKRTAKDWLILKIK